MDTTSYSWVGFEPRTRTFEFSGYGNNGIQRNCPVAFAGREEVISFVGAHDRLPDILDACVFRTKSREIYYSLAGKLRESQCPYKVRREEMRPQLRFQSDATEAICISPV